MSNDEVRQPFIYNLGGAGVVIGAGATVTQTIALEAGSHFCLTKMTGLATNPGNLSLQVHDSLFNSNWFFQPIRLTHLFGQPGWPYMFPTKMIYPERVVFTLTIQDIVGAGDTVFIDFHGYKIRNFGDEDRR